MRVFRVQRECGTGPFKQIGPTVMGRAAGDVDLYWRLPPPEDDGIAYERRHHCAVSTPRDLIRWFPRGVRKALHERAFKLFEFDVPDEKVLRGGFQVMFDPSEAELVASRPLVSA